MHRLGLPLTPTIAQALYVGLITDTGCFMYENTGPRAHMMAAELIEAGVDVQATYQRVYEDVPYGKLALLARGLANVERYDDGRLTLTSLSAEDFIEAGAEESYSEGVIDHLRAVRGTAVAALVRDRLNGSGEPADAERQAAAQGLAARRDLRIDVSAIARAQGGGGHKAAAGLHDRPALGRAGRVPARAGAAPAAGAVTRRATVQFRRAPSARPRGRRRCSTTSPPGSPRMMSSRACGARSARGVKVGHAGTLDPFATGPAARARRPRHARAALPDGAAEDLRGGRAVRLGLHRPAIPRAS